MSPVFTSGKLKGMLSLIDGALDNMINYLNKVFHIIFIILVFLYLNIYWGPNLETLRERGVRRGVSLHFQFYFFLKKENLMLLFFLKAILFWESGGTLRLNIP